MTSNVKLLPLPIWVQSRMLADAMHDYARANMEPLIAEIEALRAEWLKALGLSMQAQAEAKELRAEVAEYANMVQGYIDTIAEADAQAERLAEALRWYAAQTALCRKLGSAGDAGRSALDADGGKRARAELDQEPSHDQ